MLHFLFSGTLAAKSSLQSDFGDLWTRGIDSWHDCGSPLVVRIFYQLFFFAEISPFKDSKSRLRSGIGALFNVRNLRARFQQWRPFRAASQRRRCSLRTPHNAGSCCVHSVQINLEQLINAYVEHVFMAPNGQWPLPRSQRPC